jgi:hypothetical protein
MYRHKLKVTPDCIKCNGSTVHYRMSKHTFLNTKFIAEWFECRKCGKIQGKVVKLLGQINESKILSVA